jgi:hypothetical protein
MVTVQGRAFIVHKAYLILIFIISNLDIYARSSSSADYDS